tara:strand:- start:1653 stop:1976 length:324 start_codon:yes stop_codon:yes gene_type:complete
MKINLPVSLEILGFQESTSNNDIGINFTLLENNCDDENEIKIHLANSLYTNEDEERFAYHIITYGQDLLINYFIYSDDELLSIILSNKELLVKLQLKNNETLFKGGK